MRVVLAALLLFGAFLFLRSSGGLLTKREWAALYIAAAVLTLASQIQARWNDCGVLVGCGLSLAKAVVWSIIWPLSWLINSVGL